MADSAMDTDALLGMSLDDLIAAKGKSSKTKMQGNGAGGGGSGKMRSNARAGRRQQSVPYTSSPKAAINRGQGGSNNNRVFVGNLAWEVTWKELKDHMQQAGWAVKADVATELSGRSKGYGWVETQMTAGYGKKGVVEFKTAQDAQAAIDTLQDTDLMGRLIFLREDREASLVAPSSTVRRGNVGGGGGGKSGNCKVFVSNLAFEVGWQDLKSHMRQAGNVLNVDMFIGSDGRSKGLGVVEFSKPFEARNAIQQLSETVLMGRPINIREDRGDAAGNGDLGRGVGGGAGARVYVGNLSWQVTWQNLKDYMRQAGNVKFVDLFQEPGGRSKGCAVVEYETPQEAHTAIRDLNDTELMGRMMFVREDREEGSAASKSTGPMGGRHPGAEGRQVFVGNLAWDLSWQELKDHFKQVGPVQFVEIPEDAQGRSKGHGLVRFASKEGAELAIDELTDTELGGRRIFVKEDNHY